MLERCLVRKAAKFNLKCKIFMGTKDVERQSINVFSMRSYGAEVVPVNSGSQTLVDAVSECMRWWTSENEEAYVCWKHCWPNNFCQNMCMVYCSDI